MTEKRFTSDKWQVYDNDTVLTVDETVELLNSLVRENNKLQVANGEMEDYLARLEEKNEQLKKELQKKVDLINEVWRKYENAHGISIDNTDWF